MLAVFVGAVVAATGVAPGRDRKVSDKPVASALQLLDETSAPIGENMPSATQHMTVL